MGIYTELSLIAFIIVNIVDLSGFIDTLKHWIWNFAYKNKREYKDFDFRPFECSYCSLHHTGVIYLLIVGEFSLLTYSYLLFLCLMTPIIKDILMLAKAFIQKIIDTIYEWYDL